MKLQTRKLVSVIVAFVMILVCAVPAFAAAPSNSAGYAVNSNGETYGNYLEALEIGYEADLIYAEGIDGTLGYVRLSDLDDGVESPSDVTLQATDKIVPLYASDGITVVGQFLIPAEGEDYPQSRTSYTYGQTGVMSPPGYTGYSLSGIKSSPGGVTVTTQVTTSVLVAINWIGIQARCYRQSNGALVKSSNWVYNSDYTRAHELELFNRNPYTSNEFYSCGSVKLWNSELSDYWTYSTFRSPIAQPGT